MSSKYQKPFVIPEGFPELLKGFTREILRTQVPHDKLECGKLISYDLTCANMLAAR